MEEGLEDKRAEYQEDVMILPCTLLTDERGQLVPHVAIHQNDGCFHPIGGKVADEPWLQQEALADTVKRELLEEAIDDKVLAGQLARATGSQMLRLNKRRGMPARSLEDLNHPRAYQLRVVM